MMTPETVMISIIYAEWRKHAHFADWRFDIQHKRHSACDIQHNGIQCNNEKRDTQHNAFRIMTECCYAEYRYAECSYAECRYAERRYAECHYAESRYAECRK